MDAMRVVGTALLSVAALYIVTKLMGHKQVAQLDFFDYVSGITIGSIGAELATDPETPTEPLIALAVYGAVSMLLSWLTHHLPRTRKFINGTPCVLMDNGRIHRRALKKARLDLSEFLLLCREQGYFNLEEIAVAVFEPNGKLSVLPRAAHRPLTPDDLQLAVRPASIGTEVIMDGRVMGNNLQRLGRDERWLEKQLRAQGFRDAKDVLLGVYRPKEDRLTLYPNE